MRNTVIAGVFGLICVVAAVARGDTIGVYSDNMGTSCNIIDNTTGMLSIYVVHISTEGATASEFSAPKPDCMVGATYLSDTVAFFEVGNTQTGTSIPYGTCRMGPTHAVTMIFFAHGTSEPCCLYPVLPDPHPSVGGEVLVEDCNGNTVAAVGLVATVNGNATCPCGYPVPVEETTWGQLKAMFSE